MNKGMLTVGIIFLSIIALLLINVLNNYMTGSELDYYLVKETTDAAMEDALDRTYTTNCGLPRMDKEKFVESFIYRFVQSVDANRGYDLKFYDLNEVPPKVSVQVDSLTVLSVDNRGEKEAATISTRYSAIAESERLSDPAVEEGLRSDGHNKSYQCKPLS